jgi:hypothetical protein
MKKISFGITCIIIFLYSCTKNAGSATAGLNERIDTAAVIAAATMPGDFVSNGPIVTGTAKVYNTNGKLSLALENFSTDNGPDLHVYLSKEIMPVNFIDLGKLKATSGNQLYSITGTTDFTQYKYALIHCQQYNHLFGSAQLLK